MIEFIVQAQVLKENKFTFFRYEYLSWTEWTSFSEVWTTYLPATMYLEKKAWTKWNCTVMQVDTINLFHLLPLCPNQNQDQECKQWYVGPRYNISESAYFKIHLVLRRMSIERHCTERMHHDWAIIESR